jgi:hypothetical protein
MNIVITNYCTLLLYCDKNNRHCYPDQTFVTDICKRLAQLCSVLQSYLEYINYIAFIKRFNQWP